MTTTRELTFGKEVVPYRERRTSRRKTVALSYGSDGLEVLAPSDMSSDRIEEHVRGKARWILSKRATWIEVGGGHAPREFCAGEGFAYLGRTYRLKLVLPEDGLASRTKLRGGYLRVPVRKGMADKERALEVRRKLRIWYKDRARAKLNQRCKLYAEKLALPAPALTIHDQQKRWGSCDKQGRLRFNWRIIMAPLPLVDYVIAHELCHLIEFNHSRAFWRQLETIYPETQRARERLRLEGSRYYF